MIADQLAGQLSLDPAAKQWFLETLDAKSRVERLLDPKRASIIAWLFGKKQKRRRALSEDGSGVLPHGDRALLALVDVDAACEAPLAADGYRVEVELRDEAVGTAGAML